MIFDEMIGHTIEKIDGKVGDGTMTFHEAGGIRFVFSHQQDCCEEVQIEEIIGDLDDLIGSPLLMAEEDTNEEAPEDNPPDPDPLRVESFTWTFYRFETSKGHVDVRWLGTSNGYYSERVSFEKREGEEEADD